MVKAIQQSKITEILVLIILALLALGQLPGFVFGLIYQSPFKIHLLDIAVVLYFLINIKSFQIKSLKNPFLIFTFWASFSYILSIYLGYASFSGLMYLLRLITYIYFFVTLRSHDKENIYNSLIVIGLVVGILGWIQYLFSPDLRTLKILNWDDHLFRLVSTYLDPAFTGIILVFSELLVVNKLLQKPGKKLILTAMFLLVTIGFTYSRASFISLFFGVTYLLFKYDYKKYIVYFVFGLIALVLLLPRGVPGEGVKLERLYSIVQKVENYKESARLISVSPLIGYGYNNLCSIKVNLAASNPSSNSCSGLDNSFLFVLATTGMLGFIYFLKAIWSVIKNTASNSEGRVFIASSIALFVHTQFTNTLFYAWVIVWMAFLASISRKSNLSN